MTFTISNLGSAALSPSNLALPAGFSLVGSFPASIAAHGTATFTLQMSTAISSAYAGVVSFQSNDPNAATYSFAVKGTVTGSNTGEIHGQVYDDIGSDAIENGSDTGLVGWTVSLLNPTNNSVLATTTTSYNGYYSFLNLAAGTYRVRETPMTGWGQSTTNPADVSVAANDMLASPFGVTPLIVSNGLDSGPGSLRQAILNAARVPGIAHQIQFQLPAGLQTITLLSPLPAMADPLVAVMDATQNVTVSPSPASAWDSYNALTKTGAGALTLSEVSSFAGNIQISGGSLKLNGPTTPTFSAGIGVTVTGTGVLELGGSASDLTASVNVNNGSSAAAGIVVSGTNQVVGGINGVGNLMVNAGSALKANHVIETALIIGGSAGSPATLTIAPSDFNGNPLESQATAVSRSDSNAVAASGTSQAVAGDPFAMGGASPASAMIGNRLRADVLDALLATFSGTDPSTALWLDDQLQGGGETGRAVLTTSDSVGSGIGTAPHTKLPALDSTFASVTQDGLGSHGLEWLGAAGQTH